MRVALAQCELEHRHQAPHLAMCLFATDLRRDGHDVSCTLLHPTALDDWTERHAGAFDLLVLDSIFPFAFVERLAAIGAPVVVGGHNALQHALRGPCDLAIVGPGRAALRRLVETLAAAGDPLSVPGVWRRRAGRVECGPDPGPMRLDAELEPFEPDLEWAYAGPPRAPESNLRVPSVVAAAGCVWNRSTLGDGGPYADVRPRLPDIAMSAEAERRLRVEVEQEGGCTFCAFRYTAPSRGSLDRVLQQASALLQRGARGLSLQTEHPTPTLLPLLRGLHQRGLSDRVEELHARTIPWLLLEHRDALVEAIELAARLDVRLVMGQVGFEAFDDPTLGVYHKGLTAEQNRAAARLLGELSAEHPGFIGTAGHGLIPLHPWSTPEDLLETIAACRADAPWLLHQVHPASRVEFYDEWTPLFWKAQDDDLLKLAPDRFGWDWTYADARTGEAMAVAGALLAEGAPDSADVVEAVLRTLLDTPDPDERRQAWLSMRAEARRTTLHADL